MLYQAGYEADCPDKCVQFHDPRFKSSGEIRPKAIEGGIFVRLFEVQSLQIGSSCDVHIHCSCRLGRPGCRVKFVDFRLNSDQII